MGRVFVIQVPANKRDGEWAEKYDLSAAEHFGELIRVLPFGNVPMDPAPTKSRLLDVLFDFSAADDYVLLLGDPVALAQAVHFICTYTNGSAFRCLKWDRRRQQYDAYLVG